MLNIAPADKGSRFMSAAPERLSYRCVTASAKIQIAQRANQSMARKLASGGQILRGLPATRYMKKIARSESSIIATGDMARGDPARLAKMN